MPNLLGFDYRLKNSSLILSTLFSFLAVSFTVIFAPAVHAQSLERNSTQENAGVPTGPTEDLKALASVRKSEALVATGFNSTLDGSHMRTSTGYDTDSLNLTFSHLRPTMGAGCLGLGVAANWINGEISDLNFNYESVSASAECVFENRKISSTLGILNRSDNEDSSSQTWTGRLRYEENHETWTVGLEGGHSVFADSLQTKYATRNLVQGPSAQFNLNLQPAERIRAAYVQKIFFLSDNNRRTDGDLSVMYGLSPHWPWIWVGAGYERMTNSSSNQGHYWAPRIFEVIGPRIDFAAPVYQKLSFLMGLNFNWFRDIDFGTGFGYYGTAKFQYGQSDARHYYFGAESIASKQGSGKWDSLSWNAGVQWPF